MPSEPTPSETGPPGGSPVPPGPPSTASRPPSGRSDELAPEVAGPPRRTSGRTPLLYLANAAGPLAAAVFFFYVGTIGQSSGGGGGSGVVVLAVVAAVVVVQSAVGALGWRFRTYVVGHRELVIDEGILTRRRRVVPYDRVQQVDAHQNLMAQLFGLSEVRVATAVSSGTENVRLRFFDTAAAAGLRTYILERRASLQAAADRSPVAGREAGVTVDPAPSGAVGGPAERAETVAVPEPRVLLTLDGPRLTLAAVTHSSVIVGTLVGLVSVEWLVAIGAARSTTYPHALLWGAGLIGAVVLGGLFLLGTITQYLLHAYGFTLRSQGDDLELRMGLLETRTITVPRRRVQQVTIVDNPIRRALGLVAITLHTASSGGEQSRFELPLVDRDDVDRLLVEIMGTTSWRPPDLRSRPVRARGRAVRRRVLVTAVAFAPPAIALRPTGLLLLLIALAGIPWGAVAHRRAGYGESATLVALAHGVLLHRTELVPIARVQSARTQASPFQRRAELATFSLDVAGHHPGALGGSPQLFDFDATEAHRRMQALPRASLAAAPSAPA